MDTQKHHDIRRTIREGLKRLASMPDYVLKPEDLIIIGCLASNQVDWYTTSLNDIRASCSVENTLALRGHHNRSNAVGGASCLKRVIKQCR